MCGHICCLTLLQSLSLGLFVDELGLSYHCTPKRKPYLKRGKVKVTRHPSSNVPFIYPGCSSDNSASAKDASGDRALWEEAGAEEGEEKSEGREVVNNKNKTKKSSGDAGGDLEPSEEDEPRVRCRP